MTPGAGSDAGRTPSQSPRRTPSRSPSREHPALGPAPESRDLELSWGELGHGDVGSPCTGNPESCRARGAGHGGSRHRGLARSASSRGVSKSARPVGGPLSGAGEVNPPPQEQGIVMLFWTNSSDKLSSSLAPRTSAYPADVAVAVRPTAPASQTPPASHRATAAPKAVRAPTSNVLTPVGTAPHLWPLGPTSAPPDHPGQPNPTLRQPVGPSHVHPP
jgi:hypothetical protein